MSQLFSTKRVANPPADWESYFFQVLEQKIVKSDFVLNSLF